MQRKLSGGFALACAILATLMTAAAFAETAAFDLAGPSIEMRVRRGERTLPIGEVPNLQTGDRLWVRPALPDSQSVNYLMVVVFLRGATNPPPEDWFTRVEAWSRPVHEEGVYVTVPEGAEEALVLLAPDTGGAFGTLKRAVRGKPGAFVRAAQDLYQASLDRARLEKYLEVVRENSAADAAQLKSTTTLLARSLAIRLDQQCFDKPSAQQVPCLTQNSDQLVLDDTHSQTAVGTLTSGSSSDLMAQLSSTPTARGGYYSPYVGALVDVARILGTAHTAQYQYIPALALPKHDQLHLRLNNPPSFRNPKSVLVIGLPPVRALPLPVLIAVDPGKIFCADDPGLVLPVEGTPLAYATELGHDFVLHVEAKSGQGIDLPAKADAARGGFMIDKRDLLPTAASAELAGVLRGTWGFRSFEGPRFHLRTSRPAQWVVASKDASALIVGREDLLHVQADDACCVSDVVSRDEQGKPLKTTWKVAKPDELEVHVDLRGASAGSLTMAVKKFGLREPDEIHLHTYAEAGRLDSFTIHAGDVAGILKGTRLDQVLEGEAGGLHFQTGALARANQQDELTMVAKDAAAARLLQPGADLPLHVTLKDGRLLELSCKVEPPRPSVSVLSKSVQYDSAAASAMAVKLGDPGELPQEARLNFFLKTQSPATFPPTEKIEVATADESFRVLLSFKDGNLTLEDSRTVFAVLDPMKLLGPSAFGLLKLRPVTSDGVEGDWEPLINLVRIPALKSVNCDSGRDKPCTLSGDKLFLIDEVSADPDFTNAVTVPDGFTEETLAIPPLKGKMLYLKLRDDPAIVDTVVLPALTSSP